MVFLAAQGDTPLSPDSGGRESLPAWVPQDYTNQRETPWQALTPRALHRQQPNTPQVFLSLACAGALAQGLLVWDTAKSLGRGSQGTEADGHHFCALSLCLH